MTFDHCIKLDRWIQDRITAITEMHPLTELERIFLAMYARESVLAAQLLKEYRTVLDWLHTTSRISPRERDELKKLTEEIAAWRPEEEHAGVE